MWFSFFWMKASIKLPRWLDQELRGDHFSTRPRAPMWGRTVTLQKVGTGVEFPKRKVLIGESLDRQSYSFSL